MRRRLSNVCTHRGHLLVDGPCRKEQIRCPYHSRRFDLAGRMTFMPGFEGAPDFPGPADHLPALELGVAAGHGFAALAPAVPFDEWLAPVRARVPWWAGERFEHDPARDRDFTIAAHWALYVENYLEGLHIPVLRLGLTCSRAAPAVRWTRSKPRMSAPSSRCSAGCARGCTAVGATRRSMNWACTSFTGCWRMR